ncbi:MAG TPA: hypothetical protein VGQ83_36275, partial [Polyangia bacterium]
MTIFYAVMLPPQRRPFPRAFKALILGTYTATVLGAVGVGGVFLHRFAPRGAPLPGAAALIAAPAQRPAPAAPLAALPAPAV